MTLFKTLLLSLLMCFCTLASAMLNIEITQAFDQPRPIAVVPFQINQNVNVDDAQLIRDVINNDLRFTGQFKPVPVTNMHHFPHQASEVKPANWVADGIEAILVGSVTHISSTTYRVDFALIDVVKAQKNPQQSVLTKDSFVVSKQELRHLAHHIADQIYTQLTGVKGIFSTRIAYVLVTDKPDGREYALEVADADGYNPKPLVVSKKPIMSPSWSPDGHQLAYVTFEHDRSEIAIANVIKGGEATIVSGSKGINGAPAWSPDGRKLALVLSKEKVPDLYLLDLKTHHLKQLTRTWSIDTEPAWSPDGKKIAFTSNRGGSPQIYEITLATGAVKRLTYEGRYNARPMYTPDGGSIVMIHRGQQEREFHIASLDLEDQFVNILTAGGLDESPSVSPNGHMVIYATRADDQGILKEVSMDGRVHIKLPAPSGSVQEPAWSGFLS